MSKDESKFKVGDEVYYIGRHKSRVYCEVIDMYYNKDRKGFRYLLRGVTYSHVRMEKQEDKLNY